MLSRCFGKPEHLDCPNKVAYNNAEIGNGAHPEKKKETGVAQLVE